MKKNKYFFITILVYCCAIQILAAQYTLSGYVRDSLTQKVLPKVEVFNQTTGKLATTDEDGYFEFVDLEKGTYLITVFSFKYNVVDQYVEMDKDVSLNFELDALSEDLSEVVVRARKEILFRLRRLKPVEGTAIYAGKKTEVVLLDQLIANLAANNARQIYSQVVGLNIYENNDGGLQLNVGGRGLDPNRSANFNTRQNGYDISADVLGYPESYYTPPAEALSEIQVIRGAASLQYGTQFGGLINFKMKTPNKDKKVELLSRQSVGSYGLFTSFNSLSGTLGKFSYYTYYNYKRGDGYRDNAGFDAHNFYGLARYQVTPNTSISLEATYLHYLAQQAGGLTDEQFTQNPRQSNRARNWFEVDWQLYAFKLKHAFSTKTDFSLDVFGLRAQRNALGFRGNPVNLNTNPVTEVDEQDTNGEYILPRDLIKGRFNNIGAEARLLTRYKIAGKEAVLLVGSKLYRARNTSRQGSGSLGRGADFYFADDQFPDYASQSDFVFPNLNVAAFGEHIFYLTPKFSVTPGVRFEYIKTESQGVYQQVNFDNAGNPIFNERLNDDRILNRSFVLMGVGLSYQHAPGTEIYGNFSQNYRSVTFSDIRVVNPTFIIDPNISDEEGFTADLGIRGSWRKQISYDVGIFSLLYDDRIGIILDDRANRVRKNIGQALIYGFESFVDWNIRRTFFPDQRQLKLNLFVNAALTESEYIQSEENNVEGKKVEFIPIANVKTGVRLGYKNLLASVQYTYLSEQFTDVENSRIPESGDNRAGVIGEIPAYSIVDFSLSYNIKNWRLETGVNNLLNQNYFTRRATGYPGPGIIPSDNRNFYLTIGVRL